MNRVLWPQHFVNVCCLGVWTLDSQHFKRALVSWGAWVLVAHINSVTPPAIQTRPALEHCPSSHGSGRLVPSCSSWSTDRPFHQLPSFTRCAAAVSPPPFSVFRGLYCSHFRQVSGRRVQRPWWSRNVTVCAVSGSSSAASSVLTRRQQQDLPEKYPTMWYLRAVECSLTDV